eukprot:640543-Amphidinium_carterae.1
MQGCGGMFEGASSVTKTSDFARSSHIRNSHLLSPLLRFAGPAMRERTGWSVSNYSGCHHSTRYLRMTLPFGKVSGRPHTT